MADKEKNKGEYLFRFKTEDAKRAFQKYAFDKKVSLADVIWHALESTYPQFFINDKTKL